MADPFETYRTGLNSPAEHHYRVEIDSGGETILDPRPRALFIATDGNVEIIDIDGIAETYSVKAGMIMPFRGYALGSDTTADVIAWW